MPVALLTDGAFATDVLAHPGLVVVDVWAEWCTPCRALVPIFTTLADRYDGRVRVAKLDADANLETVTRFDVRALPTVLIFQGGALVERLSGARSLGAYVDAIDAHLARGGEAVVAMPSVERIRVPVTAISSTCEPACWACAIVAMERAAVTARASWLARKCCLNIRCMDIYPFVVMVVLL